MLLVGTFENDLDPLNKETIYEIESNKNIINAGFQKEVRSFLSSMNVFTFPSYREGLCLVLMEAGAINIPSISSDITGCREIIFNNNNGLVINSKDQQDLYNKMLCCIENPNHINEMAIISRYFVINNLNIKNFGKRV